MLTIDIRHPDVEQFIDIKKDRTKVTGANISIKIRDDFMQAVAKDEDYILRWPCNMDISEVNEKEFWDNTVKEYNKLYTIKTPNTIVYFKLVKAKELWNKIITAAHDSAEPGLLFVDRAHDYSPDGVYPQYKATNTNP